MLGELLLRDFRLSRVVRNWRPDVMAAIGGIFIAHAGAFTGVKSLVFYDTENARLQNLLTYPLATRVFVPRCYKGWTPRKRTVRYPGYHELSYLRPPNFSADREIALAEFDGVPVEGAVLGAHVVERAPEEVLDLVLLAFLGFDADE